MYLSKNVLIWNVIVTEDIPKKYFKQQGEILPLNLNYYVTAGNSYV